METTGRVRELGLSELFDVPLDEIAHLMSDVTDRASIRLTDEELMRAVLYLYELVRLTPRVQTYLEAGKQLLHQRKEEQAMWAGKTPLAVRSSA